MAIANFAELIETARRIGPVPIAVAVAEDDQVLASLVEGRDEGIVAPYLVGDQDAIEAIAARDNLRIDGMPLIHEPNHRQAARRVVGLVRAGDARVVVKGLLKTTELLGPVLDHQDGLRDCGLLTHVAMFDIPGRNRLLFISDGGVVLYPTWEQKLEIIRNAVHTAHRFGVAEPRVAILGASERVSGETSLGVEQLVVAKMASQGWVEDAIVEGPLPLDVAIVPDAASIKGISTAMPGTADILIVPTVEAGNIVCKALQYFSGLPAPGIVVGARAPVIINSRADDAHTRLISSAMAVVWSEGKLS